MVNFVAATVVGICEGTRQLSLVLHSKWKYYFSNVLLSTMVAMGRCMPFHLFVGLHIAYMPTYLHQFGIVHHDSS